MINGRLTYISLFSSAGIGCFGFKEAGYECIATNELIERRLKIQKINKKCKYESGYILGDIKKEIVKKRIFEEIELWKKNGNDNVDVLIATPPCQGMSVANHKKTINEIDRNSLVVESIKMISKVKPNFFIFENVAAFMKTGCTAPNGTIQQIGDVIYQELGNNYEISSRIINFKNYGSNSSRTRTLVIGVSKKFEENISPIELYPTYTKEKKLKEIIGNFSTLEWDEFDENDFYHHFRTYEKSMRNWIHDLKEGQSAFDNEDILKKPHRIVDGKIIVNKQKNGDKYTRQSWNKVAPCIHTRNDQLASQNTIHPSQDRVFSIRELMKMMTIPDNFKWIDKELSELNKLSYNEKKKILKKEEINIRQSIGEAVPTSIFLQIAKNIKHFFSKKYLKTNEINKIIKEYSLNNFDNLKVFINENKLNLGYATLCRIAELANSSREVNSAYFTNKFLVSDIVKKLPETSENEIRILEPSVGIGNFIPILLKKYEDKTLIKLDVCDIDKNVLEILKLLLSKIKIPPNVEINYINADFLKVDFTDKYFLVIGNPPFKKLNKTKAKDYLKENINKITTNIAEFFLEKALKISRNVALILPKNILNTVEFKTTRDFLSNYQISFIEDFGEKGFNGVLVETICMIINTELSPNVVEIYSKTLNKTLIQKQSYITDKTLPYWVIYRNKDFDCICKKMKFGVFNVFRDRQITNSNTTNFNDKNKIRVIKSRNISDDGTNIINISNYDSYINQEIVSKMSVFKYYNNDTVYMTPNMTYNPRVMKKDKGYVVNGSVAILIPKEKFILNDKQLRYFSTNDYREFYKIARNFQTRSLNIDETSVYWFGIKIEE